MTQYIKKFNETQKSPIKPIKPKKPHVGWVSLIKPRFLPALQKSADTADIDSIGTALIIKFEIIPQLIS